MFEFLDWMIENDYGASLLFMWWMIGCFLIVCSVLLNRFLTEIRPSLDTQEFVVLIVVGFVASFFGPVCVIFFLWAIGSAIEDNANS